MINGIYDLIHLLFVQHPENPKICLPRNLRTKLITVVGEKVNLVIPFKVSLASNFQGFFYNSLSHTLNDVQTYFLTLVTKHLNYVSTSLQRILFFCAVLQAMHRKMCHNFRDLSAGQDVDTLVTNSQNSSFWSPAPLQHHSSGQGRF